MDRNEKCRLCLSSTETKSIFSDDLERDISIQTKIMVCVSTPITRSDVLPKGVCVKCLQRVEQFYDFRELCLRSFMQLQVATARTSRSQHPNGEEEQSHQRIPHEISTVTPGTVLPYKEKTVSSVSTVDEMGTRRTHQHFSGLQYITVKEEAAFAHMTRGDNQRPSTSAVFVKPEAFLNFSDDTSQDNTRDVCEVQVSEFAITNQGNQTISLTPISMDSNGRHKGRRKTYQGELVCEICDKKFNKKYNFIRHREIHDNIFHPCSMCEKIFRRQVDLREHERTHRGTAPFHCEDCGKPFYNNSKFKMHKRGHKLAYLKKKYVLNVFHGKGTLDCNICASSCASEEDLLIHIHENHPELNTFPCNRCGSVFSSQNELQHHYITSHNQHSTN